MKSTSDGFTPVPDKSSSAPDDRISADTPAFARNNLEFAFDAGGMIRSAMNEGRSTPINVSITGKNLGQAFARSPTIFCPMSARSTALWTPAFSSVSTTRSM